MGLLDRFGWKKRIPDKAPGPARVPVVEVPAPTLEVPSSDQDSEGLPAEGQAERLERVISLLEGGQLKKAGKVAEMDEWGMAGLHAVFGGLPKILDSVPMDDLPSLRVAGAAMYLLGLRTPPRSSAGGAPSVPGSTSRRRRG
jgi:hypothetical protein